jgi:hypothetical protein
MPKFPGLSSWFGTTNISKYGAHKLNETRIKVWNLRRKDPLRKESDWGRKSENISKYGAHELNETRIERKSKAKSKSSSRPRRSRDCVYHYFSVDRATPRPLWRRGSNCSASDGRPRGSQMRRSAQGWRTGLDATDRWRGLGASGSWWRSEERWLR